MKHLNLLTLLTGLCATAMAQTVTTSIQHGGLTRDFIRHVPAIYNAQQPTPLVIVLHGLGDNMANMAQAGFHQVADTANFIVLTPQAIFDDLTQATAWNSGAGTAGIGPSQGIDDVGFMAALIDSTAALYNVNAEMVFVCGFSNGGFMTNRLACELNDRFAAFASVAGTIGGNVTCNPGRVLPFCHFHGTADSNVGYDGSFFGISVPDWLTFWKTNNNCGPDEDYRHLANLYNDGYTVETYFYTDGGSPDSRVLHYKVNGADHIWLGPQNDVFYTVEIWRFFMNYPLLPHATAINEAAATAVTMSPNPTNDLVQLRMANNTMQGVRVMDLMGRAILTQPAQSVTTTIDLSSFKPGSYVMEVSLSNGQIWHGQVVKE